MKILLPCAFLALLQIATCQPALTAPPQSDTAEKSAGTRTIEKKLIGTWYGPDCGGDYTFNADGTFDVKNFTPGNNTLTGTWSIRWDALPPTLVLTIKSSDFRKRDSQREEYPFVGKDREQSLLQLNEKALVFHYPNDKRAWHFSRDPMEGGHVTHIK